MIPHQDEREKSDIFKMKHILLSALVLLLCVGTPCAETIVLGHLARRGKHLSPIQIGAMEVTSVAINMALEAFLETGALKGHDFK